jgi:ribonuclease P protein component
LGTIVAKRHVRTAVERNRLKRVIRESFRQNKDRLAGLDVIVIADRHSDGMMNKQIFSALETHWRKISDENSLDSTHKTIPIHD